MAPLILSPFPQKKDDLDIDFEAASLPHGTLYNPT